MAHKAQDFTVLQSTSELHYHTMPGPLASRRASPQRDAILRHLSRIPASRFPEFVADLLVSSEGHKLISVTDGPGDEKQDILTLTSNGERHLTQCKHTVDFNRTVPGDELDLMLAACLRKNCKSALYVTNADLTTQAKRYVEDNEYARGWPLEGKPPEIKYWNAIRIWSRIANNAPLLNKWFGGMAQAHGLRRFRFDVHLSELPAGNTSSLEAKAIANLLGSAAIDKDPNRFCGASEPDFQWTFRDNIRSNLDLDVEYVGTNERNGRLNIPVRTIEVEITAAETVAQYDPGIFRDQVTLRLLDVLPATEPQSWWHAVATRPSAFVYLADINEPKVVRISTPCTYVRVGSKSRPELELVLLQGDEYKRSADAEEQGEFRWTHSASATDVLIGVQQQRHPLQIHEQATIVAGQVAAMQDAQLVTIDVSDPSLADRIRRLTDLDWTVMAQGVAQVHVAIPLHVDMTRVADFVRGLARLGLSAQPTPDEQKSRIVEHLLTQPMPEGEVCSFESSLVTPVALNERILWLTREVDAPCNLYDVAVATAVLKYKIDYEAGHGFDLLEGKTEATISGVEVPRVLFSPLVLRGERMIDVASSQGKWAIVLRVRERSLETSNVCVERALTELTRIVSDLMAICTPASPDAELKARPEMPQAPEVQQTKRLYSPKEQYALGDVIEHPKFGIGTVMHVEPPRVRVRFVDGERTLACGV